MIYLTIKDECRRAKTSRRITEFKFIYSKTFLVGRAYISINQLLKVTYINILAYRITSYNVCYTKLLRPKNPLFLAANSAAKTAPSANPLRDFALW